MMNVPPPINPSKSCQPLPFVETPTALDIFHAVMWCHDNGKMGLIIGAPGVGKTTALRELCSRHETIAMVTMIPALRSLTASLGHITRALGFTNRHGHSSDRLVDILYYLRKGFDSNCLTIIDEAQHLSDAAIDTLRSVHDETGAGIVFSGNPTFRSRFNNERGGFGQVISRISMRPPAFEKPRRGDVEAICDNCSIVDERAREFLFKHSQNLGGLRTVSELIQGGRGYSEGEAVNISHLRDALAFLGVNEGRSFQ